MVVTSRKNAGARQGDDMAVSHAIDWALIDQTSDHPVAVGDVVSADAGGMPIYRVVGLKGRQLELANERDAIIGALPLERFRWRGAEV